MALQIAFTPATGIALPTAYFRLQGAAYDRDNGWSFEVRGYATAALAAAGNADVYRTWFNPSSADQATYFAGVLSGSGANLATRAYTWLATHPFFAGAISV